MRLCESFGPAPEISTCLPEYRVSMMNELMTRAERYVLRVQIKHSVYGGRKGFYRNNMRIYRFALFFLRFKPLMIFSVLEQPYMMGDAHSVSILYLLLNEVIKFIVHNTSNSTSNIQ